MRNAAIKRFAQRFFVKWYLSHDPASSVLLVRLILAGELENTKSYFKADNAFALYRCKSLKFLFQLHTR